MGPPMGSEDDGKYRKMQNEPTPSLSLPVKDVKTSPSHEGEKDMKNSNDVMRKIKGHWFSCYLDYSVRSVIRYLNNCENLFSLSMEEKAALPNYLKVHTRYFFFENVNSVVNYKYITSVTEDEYY